MVAGAGDTAGELELSLLIKLLGAVGPQMRADDPAALVEMIKLHQSMVSVEVGDGDSIFELNLSIHLYIYLSIHLSIYVHTYICR